jgi:hypothetical protein
VIRNRRVAEGVSQATIKDAAMPRLLMCVLLLGPLGACTYVNEQPARQPHSGYVQGAPYGAYQVPRDSYEAERQAYERGVRDGAAGRTAW